MRLVVNMDPTRTVTLRNRFIADATRRYRDLMRAIWVSVVDRDVLSLGTSPTGLAAVPADPSQFMFSRNPEKMDRFMRWLDEQERAGVLELTHGPRGPEPWSNLYVRSAYQKGLANALIRLRQKGVDVPSPTVFGPGGVLGLFNQPFHAERVGLIYTRTFHELQGVTRAMDARISETLASGMMRGIGPEEMARELNNRVDKIGLTRSKLIARTETVQAYNQAAVGEFARASEIIGEPIHVEWMTAEDERVRSSHAARHGRIFTQEEGLQLLGEPNCLVGDSVVYSPTDIHRMFKRRYKGFVVDIETASGNKLTCTPNHPIATPSGMVPAGGLDIGSEVISCPMPDAAFAVKEDENNAVASIKDKFSAFRLSSKVFFGPSMPMHFHGDGAGSKVNIVLTDRKLMDHIKATFSEHFGKFGFYRVNGALLAKNAIGSFYKGLVGALHSTYGIMRGLCLVPALGLGHAHPFDFFSLTMPPGGDAPLCQQSFDGFAANPEFIGKGLDGRAGQVSFNQAVSVDSVKDAEFDMFNPGKGQPALDDFVGDRVLFGKLRDWASFGDVFVDQIINVNVRVYDGHVYNLQSSDNLYIAQNIINGNCRCSLLPYIESVDGKAKLSKASTYRKAA